MYVAIKGIVMPMALSAYFKQKHDQMLLLGFIMGPG